jgi:hypothetical protein
LIRIGKRRGYSEQVLRKKVRMALANVALSLVAQLDR